MLKTIEKYINKLGVLNHAVVSLIAMIPLYLIFDTFGYDGAEFIAATIMSVGYYFREVTQAQAFHKMKGIDAYNPMKWMPHDKTQQVFVVVVTYAAAWIVKIT